jgi:hypothetical protein
MRPAHPGDLSDPLSEPDADALLTAVNRVRSAVVVAEYSSLARHLAACDGEHRAVLIHDLLSLRSRSFELAGLTPDFSRISESEELDWLSAADFLIYASAAEHARFAPRLPGKVHVLFLPSIRGRYSRPPAGRDPRAVFIGVRHAGNLDALDILLSSVWPKVRTVLPEAELWVVGEIGSHVPRPYAPGIRVLGRIRDLSSVGGPDAVGLAPARAASGVSIKIATYLELGMPVLATEKALEGFGAKLDEAVLTVENMDAFTNALIDLLGNERARHELAQRGVQRPDDRPEAELAAVLAKLRGNASTAFRPATAHSAREGS